jgi:glycosyltransferase involved in cell wall biosynthesis
MKDNWTIFGEPKPLTYGGSLRRSNVFNSLAERTEADVVPRSGRIRNGVFQRMNSQLNPLRRHRYAVSTGLMQASMFAPTRKTVRWMAVDLHDHPVLQAQAMGINLDQALIGRRMKKWEENVVNFETLIVPSRAFAHYAGLSDDRLLVISNGTAMAGIEPLPFPNRPVIGMATGAARGRGIEDLITAAEQARRKIPDLELNLWLAANDLVAAQYIQELQERTAGAPWVTITSPTFREVFAATSQVSLMVIPHPPNEYMDVALPVKLFDAFAVARPVLSTPRTETAHIIRSEGVGWVTEGDGVEALSEAIVGALSSHEELKSRGLRGWVLAQGQYNWQRLSEQVADALLGKASTPRA